ncbi:hypothetical protein [Agromyces subbeticus]|uniref:hypothetical protein n=1 Tax=Agromyces subbeticus TaxID=293890 RepID=UPI0012EC2798|nr:hypothetical protein [Agromyces subbeticus]
MSKKKSARPSEPDHELDPHAVIEPGTEIARMSPLERARRLLTNSTRYRNSAAHRTAGLTWAQLEVAAATDRQTAALLLVHGELQRSSRIALALAQIALYGTPADRFPEGVLPQIKANLGILTDGESTASVPGSPGESEHS